MGFKVIIFSDQENCPAKFSTNQMIIADYLDQKTLEKFAAKCDVISFEFENIPAKTVEILSKKMPNPSKC